jgi:hypothetical protein
MEANFVLKSLGEPLGKKPPFIGQENFPLQSSRGAPEQIPEWLRTILQNKYIGTAQPGAEPRVTPDLENCKNTHTKNMISLGFLKSLEKVLKLYVEKHQEMSREKKPNVERCETFQSEESVKPFNSKTQ